MIKQPQTGIYPVLSALVLLLKIVGWHGMGGIAHILLYFKWLKIAKKIRKKRQQIR